MLTAGSFVSGGASFHFALLGRFDQAMVAIALSFVLDGLDGRLARLLRAQTRFGERFDSIADFLAFGAAPAFLLYQWQLKDAGVWGLGVVMLYALCAAFRLARFTRQARKQRVNAKPGRYFQGCPAPAAAGLALMPPMLLLSSLAYQAPIWLTAGWTLLIAYLMASRIPMISPKGWRIRADWAIPLMFLAGLLMLGLYRDGWLTASIVFTVYLLSMPLAWRWRRDERRARGAALQREAPGAQAAALPS